MQPHYGTCCLPSRGWEGTGIGATYEWQPSKCLVWHRFRGFRHHKAAIKISSISGTDIRGK